YLRDGGKILTGFQALFNVLSLGESLFLRKILLSFFQRDRRALEPDQNMMGRDLLIIVLVIVVVFLQRVAIDFRVLYHRLSRHVGEDVFPGERDLLLGLRTLIDVHDLGLTG